MWKKQKRVICVMGPHIAEIRNLSVFDIREFRIAVLTKSNSKVSLDHICMAIRMK